MGRPVSQSPRGMEGVAGVRSHVDRCTYLRAARVVSLELRPYSLHMASSPSSFFHRAASEAITSSSSSVFRLMFWTVCARERIP